MVPNSGPGIINYGYPQGLTKKVDFRFIVGQVPVVSCIPGGLLSTLMFRSEISKTVSNKSLSSTFEQKIIRYMISAKENSTVWQLFLV